MIVTENQNYMVFDGRNRFDPLMESRKKITKLAAKVKDYFSCMPGDLPNIRTFRRGHIS